jgi:hypothetical protein
VEKHHLMTDSSKIHDQGLAELPPGRVWVQLNCFDDLAVLVPTSRPWTKKETDDENPQ